MPIIILTITVVVVTVVSLFLAAGRLKESGGALAHATREIILRMELLEDRLSQIESASREQMSGLRDALQFSSRAEREEVAKNFSLLGEAQSRSLREIAALQKNSLDSLA
ncbi:MAG: hypothetical protein LBS93_06970, partial [Synergistaceae bacterium]|nr:hypothetical protein [Synergistaceae bacterium]